MKDYKKLAKFIIENVGGKENVISLTHCITRLRFQLKDESKANTNLLQERDEITSVLKSGGQYQVVLGNIVSDVYDAVNEVGKFTVSQETMNQADKKLSEKLVDLISSIFTPLLGLLCATGIIKGGSILFVGFGWITQQSGTFQILQVIGDSMLYFAPMYVGYTAAKKFGLNEFVGMAIGACLIHPTITSNVEGEALYTLFKGSIIESSVQMTFLKLPVLLMDYTSSVFPVILAAYAGSKVEKFFKKITPDVIKMFIVPAMTLLITVPLTLIIIGPITTWIAQLLGTITMEISELSPVLTGVVVGGLWQVFVMFGLHHGLMPISLNNMTVYGYDNVLASRIVVCFATMGVVLAVYFKTKDKKLKRTAMPAAISSFFGISEPSIYGVTLPLKKPFIVTCIVGAIGGGLSAFFGARYYRQGGLGILALPSYIGENGIDKGFIGVLIAIVISAILGFVLTWLFGYKDDDVKIKSIDTTDSIVKQLYVDQPIEGELVDISEVPDPVFSSETVGKGVAIKPTKGIVIAPADATIETFFPTKHAIGLKTDEDIEILIHVGIDTVQLNGEYFTSHVQQGDHVNKGDILLEFDIDSIVKAGYSVITPIVITNTSEYIDVIPLNEDEHILTIIL